ncbi:MAG: tetratricopeptide repeat protein [Saprospiraceae bacterium]|nr:tetratricopeptide repeat protein [Saprospiraceae bacterium]
MKLLLVFGLGFFCTFLPSITAETPTIDSLEQKLSLTTDPTEQGTLLLKLADAYKLVNVNKVRGYIERAEAIEAFANQPGVQDKIRYRYGVLASRENKLDSADLIFSNFLEHVDESTVDSLIYADVLYELGNVRRLKGEIDDAINYLNKSKNISLELKRNKDVASVDVALGIIHKNRGQYDKAIEYYDAAYKIFEEQNLKNNMASCVLNIANVYTRQKKYEAALEKYNEAIEIGKDLEEKDNLLAFVYGNVSNLYSLTNETEKALDYATKSYELRKSKAGPQELATSLLGIANAYNKLNRFEEALQTLIQIESTIETSSGLLEVKERLYESKYKIYENAGRSKEALEAVSEYLIYHDSLRKTELDKQALELDAKFDTERKEQQITMLNLQNEATSAKLKATRRQAFILIGGLLLVTALGFLIYRLYIKTQEQNKVINKALQEKDILLREIHHRVKNNLQFISSLLGLQSEHISDVSALSALQEGQDRVQSMALIHQNLYQEDNLTGVEVKDYFIKLIRNLFDSYNIRPGQIQLDLEIDQLNLDVDTVIPIGLIVNELVSNALKYAFKSLQKGEIKVSLKEINGQLQLQVSDNGVGITDEEMGKVGNSFGYRLINVFKDQLQADLKITNDHGTSVVMNIGKFRKVA